MHIEQRIWTPESMWQTIRSDNSQASSFQLVFVFGNKHLVNSPGIYEEIRASYPRADVIICPSSGEIMNEKISEKSLALTALELEYSNCKAFHLPSRSGLTPVDIEQKIGNIGNLRNCSGLLLFTAEQAENSDILKDRLHQFTGGEIPITNIHTSFRPGDKDGGIGLNQNPAPGNIVMIALFGNGMKIGQKRVSLCDIQSHTYKITKAEGNIIYELDGISALKCFRKHLPHQLSSRFGSYLLPSLNLKSESSKVHNAQIHRIDEDLQAITLMQRVNEGMELTILQTDPRHLHDGFKDSQFRAELAPKKNEFALIQSSHERKKILGPYAQKEVEIIKENMGADTALAGFYIENDESTEAASVPDNFCHYTITTISETSQ